VECYRSEAYSFINNYERSIIDRAQYNQITDFNNEYESSGDQEFDAWYRAAYNHLRKKVLPLIKNSNEKFITYWECYAEWGKRSEMHSMKGGYGYSFTHSNFGNGYLCLSDKSINIVSLGQISVQYPLYKQGKVISAIDNLFGMNNILEKSDNILTIPYRTELDVQEVGIVIELFTPILTWMIHPLNPNSKPFILTGIRMGLLGKYDNLGPVPSNLTKQPSEEVLDLIKKLGDLKLAGIISNEDFEQKKKELLARL